MSPAWQNMMWMLAIVLAVIVAPAFAQSPSCTTLALGQTQDITAFSVCKRVTLASVPGPDAVSICVPTNIDAAQWQSFYDNPPPGVTVEECSGACGVGGWYYSLNKACYYTNAGEVQSCDTICSARNGCNIQFTRDIGSDNTDGSRCSAVTSGLTGQALTASTSTGYAAGCVALNIKGGWMAANYYNPPTTCASAEVGGRVCACNLGSGCNRPWGGQIDSGDSLTAYASATGTPTCTSQTRTCTNGSLSGSYTNQSCTPGCALPWGGYIANGANVTAYQSATGSPTCTSQTRTCSAGTLSGSYTNQTCAAGCNLPWGGSINSGQSVTAYAAAAGTPTCTSQTRTCTNGSLSGSYTNQACTAGCALPWGGYIASGASVTAYQVASHANCASVDETRTCSNGTLSGSYTNQSCSAPPSCGGYSYGGYCYYRGTGSNQSCDFVCASRGGCNLAGTIAIGSGGTNTACHDVAFGTGAGGSWGGNPTGQALGCVYVGPAAQTRRYTSPATTCAASIATTIVRMCACNN